MVAEIAPGCDVPASDEGIRLAVALEEAHFATRQIETDAAVVRLTTATKPITLTGETARAELHIERIPLDRAVDVAPAVREENGVLIYSVVEERVFLQKQLFVVEEVRITRTTTTHTVELPTTVREQRATVEHRTPASTGETNG